MLRDIADNEDGGGLDTVDLFELYVPTLLRPDSVVRDEQKREQAVRRQMRDPELSPTETADLARVHAGSLQRSWVVEWRRPAGVSPLRALAEHRHLVVVGPPGAGKTTLLRVVELTQIDPELRYPWGDHEPPPVPRVPASIRLAEFAAALQAEPGLPLMAYLEQAVPHAISALRAGEALLLLDGLDEIDTLKLRKDVATAIRAAVDTHERLGCVVTSRPGGLVLLPEFSVFHLDPFSEIMAIEFLVRWQASRERRAGKARPREVLRREVIAHWKTMSAQASLEQLARNPLMLAILAVCDEAHDKLPHDRVQFYERALRTLLDTWNHSRAGDAQEPPVPLDVQWRAWGELALVLRAAFPIGVFPRAAVKRGLVAQLVALGEPEATGSELAELLLRRAIERHGLLERRGSDDFAFWHATFGEYLAATAIAQDGTPQRLVALRGDLRNVEIAAMTLGHVAIIQGARARAAAWLATLAAEDDRGWGPLPTEPFEFTTACIVSGCGAMRESIDALLRVAAARVLELPYRPWMTAFVRLADAVPALRPSAELVRSLAPLTRPTRVAAVAGTQPAALRLLAHASASDETARQLCREVASSAFPYDPHTSAYAALGLLRAREVAAAWLPAVAAVDWHDERSAERELNEFATALRDALKDRQVARELGGLLGATDPTVRRAAALALALLGDARPAVLNELLADREGVRLEPVEQVVLAWLARCEPAAAERLVAAAIADLGREQAESERSWAPACVARTLDLRGPHCDAIVVRLVDALSCELERADGPAWRFLSKLVAGHERGHVAASLLREGQRRLLADPDATGLALRCALLSEHLNDREGQTVELEIVVASARRGSIRQRLVAHARLASMWSHSERDGWHAVLADVEVALLAEALQHPQEEVPTADPVWEAYCGRSAYMLSATHVRSWGALCDHVFGVIEHGCARTSEQPRAYVEPLRRAIAGEIEPLRSYAAVLLAPLVDEPAEREQVATILVGLLDGSHLELRATAARWLARQRERSEVAAQIAPHALQLALCAGMRFHERDEYGPAIAALGPADDALVVAILHDRFPVHGLDPGWLFARPETVELVASYIGHDDDDLHIRAFELLRLGLDREDLTAAIFRCGLTTTVDNAANFANLLRQRFPDRHHDPRVDTLWRRSLEATHPVVLWRAVDSLLWRDGPGPAIESALLRSVADEDPYVRACAAWTCVAYLARTTEPPIGPSALAEQLAGLVSVEPVLVALTAVARCDDPRLVGAAAIMLHALGGPVELVRDALDRLTRDPRALNSTFSLSGPNLSDLTRIAVTPAIARCTEPLKSVAEWAQMMRAVGLGGPDPGARDRLFAALADEPDDGDRRSRSRHDELHLRLLLAVDADAAGRAINRLFAAIDAARAECAACATPWHLEPAFVAAAAVRERWWELIGRCLDHDLVLQRAVEHLLRVWPSDEERRRAWADRRSASTHLRERIRGMLTRFLVADEPNIRYAAARWCCQLGEPDRAALAIWAEGLVAEWPGRSLFRNLDVGDDGEIARGTQYLCEQVELWRSSPRHMRAIMWLLERCSQPPPGAREVVRAALGSDDDELRLAAASLCEQHDLDAPLAELAAIWRVALAGARPSLDARHVADIVLRLAPGDAVAVGTLRRGAIEGARLDRLRALDSLAACPEEHAFVRAQLAAWLDEMLEDEPESDSSRALLLWLRVGAEETTVAERVIAAVMHGRLDLAAMAQDPSRARVPRGGRGIAPLEAGRLLAHVVTVIDGALAKTLSQAVEFDVARVSAIWSRITAGQRCSHEDARVVRAVVTCRTEDDDRTQFARGWWFGRLPKDDHAKPIWPPLAGVGLHSAAVSPVDASRQDLRAAYNPHTTLVQPPPPATPPPAPTPTKPMPEPPATQHVDVGIVIALPEELREVLALVGNYDRHPAADLDTYLFTRGAYRCAVTLVGEMGETQAGMFTERLISTLDPGVILSMGIAGGLNDLLAGDVHVPSQATQYIQDSKAAPAAGGGYSIVPGAPAYRADFALIKAVRAFEFDHPSAHQQWVAAGAADLAKLLPDAAKRAALVAEKQVRGDVRLLADGHVATGPAVGAAKAFSDWIRSYDRNVKSLEMEAAAVLLAAQTRSEPKRALAIRAISDFGDEHKKELDQKGEGVLRRYAMRNAVRLLWALLDAEALPYHPR